MVEIRVGSINKGKVRESLKEEKNIKEYAEVISSTNKFTYIENKENFGVFMKMSQKSSIGHESLKRFIISKTKFKANREVVKRFLLEEMKITENNEELIEVFSPFNNFSFRFDEYGRMYPFSVCY